MNAPTDPFDPAPPATAAAPAAGLLRRRPVTRRSFVCQCGRPIFFRNSRCLACLRPLGYEPESGEMLALEEADASGLWRASGAHAAKVPGRWRRCANLDTPSGCNWLLPAPPDARGQEPPPAPDAGGDALAPLKHQCRACRLNRTVPDASDAAGALWWARVEQAKRRLVSSLIALGLPVASRVAEDPARGLAFDLLRPAPNQPVSTGHADGVITLNLEEADDVQRERTRVQMKETYRTLLGHLRHEVGHYYWQRLVDGGRWHAPFRELFGDERLDYAAALERHYREGPAPDWATRCVSPYASAHPWEDWAETWAHYLHILDTLDTATSFGLHRQRADGSMLPFSAIVLHGGREARDGPPFLPFINAWIELTAVMNELARSMGQADLYPFVLSAPAVTKLHFVHQVIYARRERRASPRSSTATGTRRAQD
ncbi:MAG TPA: putative zinc-binding metallopeptidase [Methylibium sp.]|uniref:zinc-binding metallopeptidase family protein n=1 Tax=Methylibium sp. TaxID=2067992 RepID=UPI002DBD7C47|nr:putative zinc-binding metallopeptidase [Methylibium sp.]HEU4459092.1 putative zinc-binding metallopeptidase [Methylibium sp.]